MNNNNANNKSLRLDPRVRPVFYDVTYAPHPLQRSVSGRVNIVLRIATDVENDPDLQRSSIVDNNRDRSPSSTDKKENHAQISEITLHALNIVTHQARCFISSSASSPRVCYTYNDDKNKNNNQIMKVSSSAENETITFHLPDPIKLSTTSESPRDNDNIRIELDLLFVSAIQKSIPHGTRSEGFFFSSEVDWKDTNEWLLLERSRLNSSEDENEDNNNDVNDDKNIQLAKLSDTLLKQGKHIPDADDDDDEGQDNNKKNKLARIVRDLWTITTQLEPCNARRICPCFDEPSFRAVWTMHVILPKQIEALSFSQVLSEKSLSEFFSGDEKTLLKNFLLCHCSHVHGEKYMQEVIDGNTPEKGRPHSSPASFVSGGEDKDGSSTTSKSCSCFDDAKKIEAIESAYVVRTFSITNTTTSSSVTVTIPPHIVSLYTSPRNAFRLLKDEIPARQVQMYREKKNNNIAEKNTRNALELVEVDAPAVPLSIVVPNNVSHLSAGSFSLNVMHRVVLFIEKLFKRPLPPPLLQLVPSSEFSSLGMENWGLLLMQSDYLFVIDPKSNDACDQNSATTTTSSSATRTPIERIQRIARLVSHEVLHQWFGDSTAPEYWDLVWSKEGVVRFFEYVCCEGLFPEWNLFGSFYEKITKDALLSDKAAYEEDKLNGFHNDDNNNSTKTETSNKTEDKKPEQKQRPISIPPATHPRVIMDLFDVITYGKAGSVLRMFYDCFGHDIFVDGFSRYLCRFAWSHARLENLTDAIEEAIMVADINTSPALQPQQKPPRWRIISNDTNWNGKELNLNELVSILIDQQVGHAIVNITDVRECGCCKLSAGDSIIKAVPPPHCHRECNNNYQSLPPLLVPVFMSSSSSSTTKTRSLSSLCFWDCRNSSFLNYRCPNNDSNICVVSSSDKSNSNNSTNISSLCAVGPYRFISSEVSSSPSGATIKKDEDDASSSAFSFVKGLMKFCFEQNSNASHIFDCLVLDLPPSLARLKEVGTALHESLVITTATSESSKKDDDKKDNNNQNSDVASSSSSTSTKSKIELEVLSVQKEQERGMQLLEAWVKLMNETTDTGKVHRHQLLSRNSLDVLSDYLNSLLILAKSSSASEFSKRVNRLYFDVSCLKFSTSPIKPKKNSESEQQAAATINDKVAELIEQHFNDGNDALLRSYCHHTQWSDKKNLPSSLHAFYLAGLKYHEQEQEQEAPNQEQQPIHKRMCQRLYSCLKDHLVDVGFGNVDDDDDDDDEEDDEDEETFVSSSSTSLFEEALNFVVASPLTASEQLRPFYLDFSKHLIEQLGVLNPELTLTIFQQALSARNRGTETAPHHSALALLDQVASDLVANLFNQCVSYSKNNNKKKKTNINISVKNNFVKFVLCWGFAFLDVFLKLIEDRRKRQEQQQQFSSSSTASTIISESIEQYFAVKVCLRMFQVNLIPKLLPVLGNTGEGSSVLVQLYAFDKGMRRFCQDGSLNGRSMYAVQVGKFCKKYAMKRYPVGVREMILEENGDQLSEEQKQEEKEFFEGCDKWMDNFLSAN